VAASEGDFQRSPGLQLTSDLGQIRPAGPVRGSLACRRVVRQPTVGLEAQRVRQLHAWRHRPRATAPIRAHEHRRLRQTRCRHDLDPVCQRSLGRAVRRHDHAPHPPPRQGGDHGQQTRHRAQVAAQR
jgi:hypothetical protein